MKKTVCFSLLAIMLVFGFSGCDNGDNNVKTFSVTIGTLTNGSITANPTSGIEGTEISLAVNPNDFYRLKPGTLKYGTTTVDEETLMFNLPAENVVVSAEFNSSFVGGWLQESGSNIFYFFENNIFAIYRTFDSLYFVKGIWELQENNISFVQYTHGNNPGYTSINGFSSEDETSSGQLTCTLSTNTTMNVNNANFTLIQ